MTLMCEQNMVNPLCKKNWILFCEIVVLLHITLSIEIHEPGDPCLSNPCAPNSNCTSTNNSNYSCQCDDGYVGNATSCIHGNLSGQDNSNATNPEKYLHSAEKGSESIVPDWYNISSNISNPCIQVLFPFPDCIPFTICDGTNPCHHGNCSTDGTTNFTCSCFDGYQNKGPGTPCEIEHICDGHCQQNCNMTSSGNWCSCLDGFILEDDGISCKFDTSSTFVQCKNDCGNGTCLNNTCCCFTDYYHDENGKCTRIDACIATPNICGKNANCVSNAGDYTCECKPNFRNISGSCQEINPCEDPSKTEYCARFGKRCRPKPPNDYECYCALPYYPLNGGAHRDACIPPSSIYHMYKLSLDLIGYYDDDSYSFLRKLENIFYNEFFPKIINVTVLNLEIKTFNPEPMYDLAHLNLHVYFAEEVSYFKNLIQYTCALYPNERNLDACILPGNIVVKNSTLDYTVLDDLCNLDSQMSEFLCGPLASCKANSTFYECSCIDGYQIGGHINPKKPLCVDIDECLRNNRTCESPTEICKNRIGNYSCECLPCYIWNEARTNCIYLCQNNPCLNGGYCQVSRIQDTCGFQCVCSEEFKGPTCTEINDSVRTSRAAVAITGGVLGGLLALVIIVGLLMIYKFQTAKSRLGI